MRMSIAKISLPKSVNRGESVAVRVAIQHPMETGYRVDNKGKLILKNTVREMNCLYNGALVFSAEMGSGIAANPYLLFYLVAKDSGLIQLDWVDDAGVKGTASALLTVV
jgi:sulfur-oxidizing protein SoxZ